MYTTCIQLRQPGMLRCCLRRTFSLPTRRCLAGKVGRLRQ